MRIRQFYVESVIESFYTDIILEHTDMILYYWYQIVEHIDNTFTVPCEKYKMVSFDFSIVKNIVVFWSQSKFAVKLICCISIGLAWSACCLLKSIAINI